MVFDVVNQPSVFCRCFRNLTAVFGLHRKLPDDLLAFFLKNQAVSIPLYHIAPEGITDGGCYEKAAPFHKPTADNRLINRQKAIPYKGAGCGCRSIEDRPAPFFSSVNGKHSDDKQIERRCRLITKDRCREKANGSKGDGVPGDLLGKSTIGKVNGIWCAKDGALYFCDVTAQSVRKLTPGAGGDYSKGKLETIASGFYPSDVVVSEDCAKIFVTSATTNTIRLIEII